MNATIPLSTEEARSREEEEQAAAEELARYQPKTELGRRILELRAAQKEAGAWLLDWHEIEQEVANRRGGVQHEE